MSGWDVRFSQAISAWCVCPRISGQGGYRTPEQAERALDIVQHLLVSVPDPEARERNAIEALETWAEHADYTRVGVWFLAHKSPKNPERYCVVLATPETGDGYGPRGPCPNGENRFFGNFKLEALTQAVAWVLSGAPQ